MAKNNVISPFGDFDLIFSSSYSGQSIVGFLYIIDQVYGKTQISRFRDGFRLIAYFISSLKTYNTSINK